MQIDIAHLATGFGEMLSKIGRGGALYIMRPALAVQRDLLRRHPGEIGGDVAVSGDAVAAAVDLRNSKSNGIPCFVVERLGQRTLQIDKPGKDIGADRHKAVEVRNETKLFVDSVKNRLRGSGSVVAGGNGNT
ncbi:MAG: hypothetical protein QOF90_1526 [Acetobacteraceae bacterium]|nr:hypothetical protein [Acetobacteraceae bacterium]